MTTPSYSAIAIPNTEMIILSAHRAFPAEIYAIKIERTNELSSKIVDDELVICVDYIGCGFDVAMGKN